MSAEISIKRERERETKTETERVWQACLFALARAKPGVYSHC